MASRTRTAPRAGTAAGHRQPLRGDGPILRNAAVQVVDVAGVLVSLVQEARSNRAGRSVAISKLTVAGPVPGSHSGPISNWKLRNSPTRPPGTHCGDVDQTDKVESGAFPGFAPNRPRFGGGTRRMTLELTEKPTTKQVRTRSLAGRVANRDGGKRGKPGRKVALTRLGTVVTLPSPVATGQAGRSSEASDPVNWQRPIEHTEDVLKRTRDRSRIGPRLVGLLSGT